MLRSLFRPKWQHKDPIIRSQAIAALNPNQAGEVLYQIALTDEEHSVRQTAISRINQLKLLHTLYHKTPFAADKQHIQQCWCSVLSDADLTTAVQAENIVLDCQEPHWLAAIVRYSNNSSLKHLALTGLRDETLIFQLLEHTRDSHLWQLLVQQLVGEEALKQALNIIRGRDKRTTQWLRHRLDELQKEQQEQQAIKEQSEEIESRLQQLLNSDHTPLLEGILLNIEQQLQQTELASEKTLELLAQCQKKLAEQLQQEALQRAQQEQQQLAEQLWQTLSSQLTLSSNELQQLESLVDNDDALVQQSIKKTQSLLAVIEQFEQLQQTIAEQEAGSKKLALIEQAIALIKPYSSLKQLHLNALQQQASQLRQQSKQQQQSQQRSSKKLQALIKQADEAIAQSDFALLQTLYPQARGEFNQLDSQQRATFNAAMQRLQAAQGELRQWQEFATDPLREELCDAMEKLSSSDQHPREKAKQIKAIQQRWKKLGFCHDQALWQRFQTLSDQAYEPCKLYFAEQKEQKQFNAEQCTIICQQIEQLQANIDWQEVDFRSLDKLVKSIEQEWRKYNFLERAQFKALQQRYFDAINPLRDKLHQHKKANTAQLEQLVSQANALLQAENPQQALDEYQAIHEQWKTVGISFFRAQRNLWQQLRQVGDELYQRRSQQRNEAEEQLQENLKQAETIIAELQSCDNDEQLKALQQQFQSLGGLPKNQYKAIQSQYHAAIKQYHKKQYLQQINYTISQLKEVLKQAAQCDAAETESCDITINEQWPSDWQQRLNLHQQNKKRAYAEQLKQLCIETEILANCPTPKEDEPLRMQIQMQQLQAHFNQGQNQQQLDLLIELILQWAELDKQAVENLAHYQQRFQQAVDGAFKALLA